MIEVIAHKKEDLPIDLPQIVIIVKALDYYYIRMLDRMARRAKKENAPPRTVKETKQLAEVQEVLQYMTLIRNIRTNKLNEALAESAGLANEETADSSRVDELDGTKESTTTMS